MISRHILFASVAELWCHVSIWHFTTFHCTAEFGRYRRHGGRRSRQLLLMPQVSSLRTLVTSSTRWRISMALIMASYCWSYMLSATSGRGN